MSIIWAGLTIGRIPFKKIDWRCSCGQHNISLGSEDSDWNRTVTCLRCSRQYEIEFNLIDQEAITS